MSFDNSFDNNEVYNPDLASNDFDFDLFRDVSGLDTPSNVSGLDPFSNASGLDPFSNVSGLDPPSNASGLDTPSIVSDPSLLTVSPEGEAIQENRQIAGHTDSLAYLKCVCCSKVLLGDLNSNMGDAEFGKDTFICNCDDLSLSKIKIEGNEPYTRKYYKEFFQKYLR